MLSYKTANNIMTHCTFFKVVIRLRNELKEIVLYCCSHFPSKIVRHIILLVYVSELGVVMNCSKLPYVIFSVQILQLLVYIYENCVDCGNESLHIM